MRILVGDNPACQHCGTTKHVYWIRDYGYICADCLDGDWV